MTTKNVPTFKIRKNNDYNISLNREFELLIQNIKVKSENYKYPIILKDKIDLEIPKKYININNFLNNKIDFIYQYDVIDFLKFSKINITPFIWTMMQEENIDFFNNKNELYIKFNDEYVILNDKNMDFDIINRLYKVQNHMSSGILYECAYALQDFIKHKISNSIGHNEFVNCEIKNYKKIEQKLEKEFQQNIINLPKILFLYEKLIRTKEDYLDENYYLVPKEQIDEFYNMIQQIREILSKDYSKKYEVIQKE